MEITNISRTNSSNLTNQDYTTQDESLLNSLVINKEFGQPEDKVEIHISSPNGDLLNSIYDFRNYTTRSTIEDTSLYNTIELDPKSDLESFGYFKGQYDISYHFYRQLFQSSEANRFYITEISSDRTEIRISNNNLSYTELGQSYLNFITTRNSRAFYSDFLINAGDNTTYIGVNIALDNVNTSLPSLYIKLYEPLPSNFRLKDTFWVVEDISEAQSFNVNTEFIAEAVSDSTPLRGPNVSIELTEKNNLTTPYLNLASLLDPSTSSSYQQLQSLMEEKSVEITVDYNDFTNFIHFSSAQERLENFKYKLTQIQSIQSDINSLTGLNPLTGEGYINVSKASLQSKVDTLISKFDGYEYFLYFESGSNSWPKINTTKPYINDAPTSLASKNWLGSVEESSIFYGGKMLESNNYDNNNRDYIWNSFPEYIKSDTQNSNLELFVSMMGQHYDYIWTYARDITDLSIADNRIDHGISKDLVADTLRNFGIQLYTNSRGQDDLYISLLGIDANNNTLPSTGSLVIDTYVTASQYTIPSNDITKETYKRLYHNLPYLLKTKGTRRGLRALINCFGIPETILKVKEYGGNKKDQNIIEQFNEKFNYSLNANDLSITWDKSYKQFLDTGNQIYPDTLEFRFKLDNTIPTQSILETQDSWKNIRVTHTTGSYANIDFGLSDNSTFIYSTPIELPLYNKDWWTLNLTRETGSIEVSQTGSNQTYTLTIGNKDNSGVQYLASSSININGSTQFDYNRYGWNTTDPITFPFSGSMQELRCWIGSIPTNDFQDHILNPQSIVLNGVTGSYDDLIFRLPLGSELDISQGPTIYSVHPSQIPSFTGGYEGNLPSGGEYLDNHELFLVNTPNIGTITEIDEKVRITIPNLVPGDVLTPYISIQKPEEYPYTPDLSIVEVAISPQDSINEDIISQLGSFNIDEYIGDPRLGSSNSYPALTDLRKFYFKKYSSSQNLFDIIKLLSYFDNSLFKMVKDFVPARTNLSTGLIIKSHILERNKIARNEPTLTFVDHSGSIDTAFISGSNGLNLDINTDHTTITQYISGSIEKLNTDKSELITGELGGTIIAVHTQSKDNIVYEYNSIPLSSSAAISQNYSQLPLNPTLNNILQARTSNLYLDLDYAYSPITPVNFNFISSDLFSDLKSTAFPFLKAPVQDSNYTLKRHIDPRYNGSKLTSTLYNVYTEGDSSYGATAAIDYHPIKFAYFKEITSQSATLNGRSNVNIKYLIDSASNVTELTEANKNLFDVQNTFNKIEANIALEDINKPSKQKALNGLKGIYAGGFRYEPILLNDSIVSSVHGDLNFVFNEPIETENPDPNTQLETPIVSGIDIGTFNLANSISFPSLTSPQSTIPISLSSGITVSVRRNSSFQGEIRKRITGNITITMKISSISNQIGQVWSKNNTGPYDFFIPLPQTNLGQTSNDGLPLTNGTRVRLWDDLRYIKIPVGFTALTANSSTTTTTTTLGSGVKVEIVNYNAANGIDYLTVNSNNTQCTLGLTNNFNSFGGSPTLNIPLNTPQDVLGIDSLILTAVFQIDGIVVLPESVGITNGDFVPLSLKTLSNEPGIISSNFTFSKTASSPNISINTSPAPLIGITQIEPPYILTEAPTMIYQTGSRDHGYFNDGGVPNTPSGSLINWYFERGNDGGIGSKFTYLTASYDLSKLYWDQVISSVQGPNYFTQKLTPDMLEAPGIHLPITEFFIPKKGDLVKLYDESRLQFPYSPSFEREIVNIIYPQGSIIGTGSQGTGSYENRLIFELSGEDISNQSCRNYITNTIGEVLNFIILSKVPDETNIIINHQKGDGITSAGILFTENISQDLKNQAGEIVKRLKSQNLI